MMTINNCGLGFGYPCQPVKTESSAANGLVTVAGTAALTAGSYALEKRLTNPERFAELVTSSKPQRTLDLSQLNRLQKPLAQAKFGAEHFGNFVKQAANTPAGKGALAFTAITALGLGALSAWQTDRKNQKITEKLQLENGFLAATIPPMSTDTM